MIRLVALCVCGRCSFPFVLWHNEKFISLSLTQKKLTLPLFESFYGWQLNCTNLVQAS